MKKLNRWKDGVQSKLKCMKSEYELECGPMPKVMAAVGI